MKYEPFVSAVAVLFVLVTMLATMGCGRTKPTDDKINKPNADRILDGMSLQEVENILGAGQELPRDDPIIAKTLGKDSANNAALKWMVWLRRPDSNTEVYILVAFGTDGKVTRHQFQQITTIR